MVKDKFRHIVETALGVMGMTTPEEWVNSIPDTIQSIFFYGSAILLIYGLWGLFSNRLWSIAPIPSFIPVSWQNWLIWQKYKPRIDFDYHNSSFVIKDGLVERCEFYYAGLLVNNYKHGNAFLDISDAVLLIKQKIGVKFHKFELNLKDKSKTHKAKVQPFEHYLNQYIDFIYNDNEKNKECYPNPDYEFFWEIKNIKAVFDGPEKIIKTLPPFNGKENGKDRTF